VAQPDVDPAGLPLGGRRAADSARPRKPARNALDGPFYSVSHGCIRMHIPDAEWLFNHVEIGTTVYIVAS